MVSHKKKTFYGVVRGRQSPIVSTWAAVGELVTGHNSEFKGFKTFWEVKEYMEGKGCPNFCFYMPNDDAHTTAPAAGSKGFYAVANGTHTGIYQNWEEAEEKVSGVKHALHKWFRSEEAARRYLDESSMTREALWGANSPEDLISSVCDGLERVSLGSTGSNWSDSSNLPDLSELSDSSDLSDSGGASMYTDDLTFKDERKY